MDYLTVNDLAELKKCSIQYIYKLIKSGKLESKQEINPLNNQLQYLIPVSALPADLQAKYYNKICKDAGLVPALKEAETEIKQHKNTVKKAFEEYSEAEREEITTWIDILNEWQDIRTQHKKKTEVDPLFVAKMKLERPELSISVDILYRKYNAYRNNNLDGLIDKRGGWNKNRKDVPEKVWAAFVYYRLHNCQPTVTDCYKNTLWWTQEFYPELVDKIPSERTFRRYEEKFIAKAIKDLKLDGKKAFKDRNLCYAVRLYDKLNANDCWIADNNTLDIQSYDDNGKIHRLYATVFLDAKSGVIVGWNITDSPSSQSTILALRHAISRFGIPKTVYFDNGSEFLCYDVGGRGVRKRGSKEEKPSIINNPPPILQRLGIEMRNAEVCNAQAKPIERTFSTSKNQFSRAHTDGFCGGNILERPESLKRKIKEGKLPRDYEIRDNYGTWADYDFNLQEYGGSEVKYKGKSRLEVWNESIQNVGVRIASEDELNLMMMRSTRPQKISRNGVYVKLGKEKIWYIDDEVTIMNQGKEVYVRYDPADLSTARIYDINDRYLWTWQLADWLLLDFIGEQKEAVADLQKRKRNITKFVQEQAKGITAGLTNEQRITALDAMQRRAFANKDKFEIKLPKNIIPVRANEPLAEEYKKAVGETLEVTIDMAKANRNAAKRLGKD